MRRTYVASGKPVSPGSVDVPAHQPRTRSHGVQESFRCFGSPKGEGCEGVNQTEISHLVGLETSTKKWTNMIIIICSLAGSCRHI